MIDLCFFYLSVALLRLFFCYSLNRCFIPDHSFSRIYFSLVERFLSIHFHFHITIYLSLSGKAQQQQQQQPEMKEDDEFIYRENNGQIERQKNKSSTVIVMASVCLL